MTQSISEKTVPLNGVRVLVAEDDYFIAEEICSTLRKHGAEVVGPLPELERALTLVRSQPVDCAVLDINLQGSFAFDLASELRERGTPAIFTTGYDASVLPNELRSCVRLEKPVNLRALLQAVQSACARHAAPQES